VTAIDGQKADASEQQEMIGGMLVPPDIARKFLKEMERQEAGGGLLGLVLKLYLPMLEKQGEEEADDD
jgi:hypothetical protein